MRDALYRACGVVVARWRQRGDWWTAYRVTTLYILPGEAPGSAMRLLLTAQVCLKIGENNEF